jgi:LacI family transcriptional regulator
MAAEHLLEKGFKRFAYCGFNDTVWGVERGASFQNHIHQGGYETQDFMQSRLTVQQDWENQFSHLIDWVRSLALPIAIMCSNDERAHQLIEAVTALGLQIPEEVAVIGADNDRLVCEVTNPPLTSIVFSHEQAGYQAALKIGDIDIAKAHQFIKSYANKGIQVGDVAKEAAMSIRALQIRFKKVFKRTVHQEIRIHQVEFVAKLLTETNMPMNKIAEMSGFATSEYMSQVFRKIKGMSMSQYRKDYNHW